MNPRVTILIANRNYGHYIADAINSALTQTYRDINVVVVDDGSTDDSWNVIHQTMFKDKAHNKLSLDDGVTVKLATEGSINLWAAKLPDVNGVGPSKARNYAIEKWINQSYAFQILDADDIMAPQKVEILLNKMRQSPNIGAVYADYDNLAVETGALVREYKEPFDKSRLLAECIVHSGALISSAALASVYSDKQFYREDFRTAEDWRLWLAISQRFIIAHVPQNLTTVRVHKSNSTYSVNQDIWNENWNKIRHYIQTQAT